MDEKEIDPIQNPEKIGDKLLKMVKMIFRKPKHEKYFVKAYNIDANGLNEKTRESWNKCSEAMMKAGISFEQAQEALIKFNGIFPIH